MPVKHYCGVGESDGAEKEYLLNIYNARQPFTDFNKVKLDFNKVKLE